MFPKSILLGPEFISFKSSRFNYWLISRSYLWLIGLADKILRGGLNGSVLNYIGSPSFLFNGSYYSMGFITNNPSFWRGKCKSGSFINYPPKRYSNSKSTGADYLESYPSVAFISFNFSSTSIPYSFIRLWIVWIYLFMFRYFYDYTLASRYSFKKFTLLPLILSLLLLLLLLSCFN